MAEPIISGGGVYSIRNRQSGHIYVGSSIDLSRRLNAHRRLLARGKHHSIRLQRAWHRHGPDAFVFEIVELVEDADHLVAREQHYIDAFGAFGKHGYNMLPNAGSSRGSKRSPPTDSVREKIRLAGIGRRHDEATKAKISAANSGKKRSAEECARISAMNTGRKLSPETIAKRSAKIRGIKHPPYSAERRRNISEAKKGRPSEKAIPVVVDGVEYRSKTEAMKMLRCSFRTLRAKIAESQI